MRLRIRLIVALGLAAVATYLVNIGFTIIAQKERAIRDLHERLHKAEARLPGAYDPRASNARRDAAADDDDDDSGDDDDDDDAVAAPAAPPKRAAAAGGWTRLTDSTSGDPYWWNRATNEVTWDEPTAAADEPRHAPPPPPRPAEVTWDDRPRPPRPAAARRAGARADAPHWVHDLRRVPPPRPRPAAARRAPEPARTLLMTYAVSQNYMKTVFRAFIDTARLEARYEGHLAVFVHPDCVAFRDPRTVPWLDARRVELVRVVSCAGTSGPTYCDRNPAWGGGASPRPSLMRYVHYAQYLANHEGEFDVVLWSDFRDAVFQRNPFEDWVDDSQGKDLMFFAEHPGKPITASGHTRTWVQRCFGKEILDRIGPRDDVKPGTPALCSSNTMGTYGAITKFLAMYLAQVTAAAARDLKECFETGGIDQGHHNYIVYATLSTAGDLAEFAATAPLSKPVVGGTFVITPYDRGPVYTAGRVGSHFMSDLKRDADGYVLRSDGKRAALLHQYDRFPLELRAFYTNLQKRLNAAEVARGGVGADAVRPGAYSSALPLALPRPGAYYGRGADA